MTLKRTSIILCTYNEANYIENTISELEKNIPNLEIVIVDDASSDGSVSNTGDADTFTPNDNYNGTTSFTYLVTDGELTSSSSTVTIVVNAVNDAPVLSAIEDQSIDEDTSLVLTLSANDVDGDALTYSASVDGNGDVSVVDNQLTITPDEDYNGSIEVDVSVSDGQYIDTDSFVLTVNPVNDAPVLSDIQDQSIDEDTILSLTLSADDIDGDALTYSASVDGNGDVSIVDNELTITPDED